MIILQASIVLMTLVHECRGEPFKGQHAVASVIYVRRHEDGTDYRKVCLTPSQFSCWNPGAQIRWRDVMNELADTESGRRAWRNLNSIVDEMEAGEFKPSGRWNMYCAINVVGYKQDQWTNVVEIAGHRFGYLEGR